MKLCSANLAPPPKTFGDYMRAFGRPRKTCDKPAVYTTIMGPRCIDCGEALIDAAMGDQTLLGILLDRRGKRPTSRDEARKKLLRTFQ